MNQQHQLFGTTLTFQESIPNLKFKTDVLSILHKFHSSWNIFVDTSLLSKLNKQDSLQIDYNTRELITYAIKYYNCSNHYFNPCLYDLKAEYKHYSTFDKNADHHQTCPSPTVLRTRSTLDVENNDNPNLILIDNNSVTLNEQRLDLGGIAKGYALEIIKKLAEAQHYRDFLINFGGSILISGNSPLTKNGFNIGITHPADKQKDIIELYNVHDTTLTTSAIYEQHAVINDIKYSHIFNHEGFIPIKEQIASITLIGNNPIETDAFCTAIIAMGLKKSLIFLNKHPHLHFFLITADKEIIYRYPTQNLFKVTDSSYKIFTKEHYETNN